MARRSPARGWVTKHIKDEYVKRAQREGFRSRAVYKLKEIDHRLQLFRPGITVVELGAAPGGWSQYVLQCVGTGGKCIAIDILPMAPLVGVEFIQADFTEQTGLDLLMCALEGAQANLVISDMAPNISGNASADQARIMGLSEMALEFAVNTLNTAGGFLVKVFQGSDYNEFYQQMQVRFKQLRTLKPKASRPRSREIYLYGRDLRQ